MSGASRIEEAAEHIRQAKAMIVTAGAGMGIDSGLPDFRGNQGFWNAYPMYERLGLSFVQAANPEHFEGDPHFGWGFYGHRTNLYRATIPHSGFHILREWSSRLHLETFVVTSNVDGQFQKADFDDNQVLEVHGSIHHLQCTVPCHNTIWDHQEQYDIDESTMRAQAVPFCPRCGKVARPNILMFGDYSWLHHRCAGQESRFDQFLKKHHRQPTIVVEIGAGSAIPTIRNLSEQLGRRAQTKVLRINPREPQIGGDHYSLAGGAVEMLSQLDRALS